MIIYVKLGSKANSFSDPLSGFNIAGKQVLTLTDSQQKSKKTSDALKGGHLVRANRSEYESFKKVNLENSPSAPAPDLKKSELEKENLALREANKALKDENEKLLLKVENAGNEDTNTTDLPSFDEMSDAELEEYYKENFEVTDKQIKSFSKLPTAEKVDELIKLEAE